MKTMVLVFGLLTATVAQAQFRQLVCKGEDVVFTADQIYNPQAFEFENAKVVTTTGAQTNFTCNPVRTFGALKCTGHWNNNSSELIEATIKLHDYPGNEMILRSVTTNEKKYLWCRWK